MADTRFNAPDTDQEKDQLRVILELVEVASTLATQILFGRSDNVPHYRDELVGGVADLIEYGVITLDELRAAQSSGEE